MRRFEITYGPTEFDTFESMDDCVDDMLQRVGTMAEQEKLAPLRAIAFTRRRSSTLEAIRVVLIAGAPS